MKKTLIILSALLALSSGCARLSSSSPSASPATAPDAATNFGGLPPVTDEHCAGVWFPSTGICSRPGGG